MPASPVTNTIRRSPGRRYGEAPVEGRELADTTDHRRRSDCSGGCERTADPAGDEAIPFATDCLDVSRSAGVVL